jgi:IPT/TIG domain
VRFSRSKWGATEKFKRDCPGDKGFTLRVTGEGFTSGSKIMWNGSARSTTFADSATLTTAVTASELSAPATITVSVSGSALPAATLRVLPLGGQLYLPVVVR